MDIEKINRLTPSQRKQFAEIWVAFELALKATEDDFNKLNEKETIQTRLAYQKAVGEVQSAMDRIDNFLRAIP